VSFDDLIGAGEQRLRHGKAERLGDLEVDDQLILDRGLHRAVGRLLALKEAIDVAYCATILIDNVIAVRD
jgi:hypothetical protein